MDGLTNRTAQQPAKKLSVPIRYFCSVIEDGLINSYVLLGNIQSFKSEACVCVCGCIASHAIPDSLLPGLLDVCVVYWPGGQRIQINLPG